MKRVHARVASVALLKLMPFLDGTLMVGFCIHRVLDLPNLGMADAIGGFGIPWIPLLLLSSIGRGFCIWHRLLIIYDGLVSLLMKIESRLAFGALRLPVGLFLAAAGVFLLVKAFLKMRSGSNLANHLQEN